MCEWNAIIIVMFTRLQVVGVRKCLGALLQYVTKLGPLTKRRCSDVIRASEGNRLGGFGHDALPHVCEVPCLGQIIAAQVECAVALTTVTSR